MASNGSSTGIPSDTAKKRKGAPTANEIFTEPVPTATDKAAYNGNRGKPVPMKMYAAQSRKVSN